MKHFQANAYIATDQYAERGVTIRPARVGNGIALVLHNGCGRGNMCAITTPEMAIDIALEIISIAYNMRKVN